MTSIERAKPADRAAIETLLVAADLPLIGLELAIATAVVARDGDNVVGCAAVEPYGSAGLLRSVAVTKTLRGTGLGRRLVAEAEAFAAESGIETLFLLTESAEDWFPRLGYEASTRNAVPATLAASPEFTDACPNSAAVFRKTIATGWRSRR
jgi:amino-acid N-acetyltransferase